MLSPREIARIAQAAAEGGRKDSVGASVVADTVTTPIASLTSILNSINEGTIIVPINKNSTRSFITPVVVNQPSVTTLALWHLDEGAGATAVDSSYNGNVLSLNNISWSTGNFNKCIVLNGTNAYATSSVSSEEVVRNYLYLSVWVNTTHDGTLINWDGVCRLYISSGVLYAEWTDGNTVTTLTGPAAPSGAWFLAHTQFFDGAGYIGVNDIIYSASAGFSELKPSSYTIDFGKYSTNYFDGSLEEIFIDCDVQIEDDFQERTYQPHPKTIGYWAFDENFGSFANPSGFIGDRFILENCTWGTGWLGSAIVLNGSTSYAYLDPSYAKTSAIISVELVVNFDTTGACVLLDQDSGINLSYTGSNFQAALQGVSNPTSGLGPFVPTIGEWYCINLIYDGSYKSIWINGQKVGEVAATGAFSYPVNRLFLGCDKNLSNFFGGKMDFLHISATIQRPYYRPIPQWLVGMYGFQKNSDWTIL
jgi:Concanavalin A-like lectin/glucanases superfamily